MKITDSELLELQTYRQGMEFARIASRAVEKAKAENRRLGIPNVYTINGRLYYEKPNGELTTENLFEKIKKK